MKRHYTIITEDATVVFHSSPSQVDRLIKLIKKYSPILKTFTDLKINNDTVNKIISQLEEQKIDQIASS